VSGHWEFVLHGMISFSCRVFPGIEHDGLQLDRAGCGMTVTRNCQVVQDFVGANRCQNGIAEKSGSTERSKREYWAFKRRRAFWLQSSTRTTCLPSEAIMRGISRR